MMRELPADAWQAHYGKIANPFLWFMQHQLYTLAYEPTVDEELIDAWQNGYRVVNEAFADGRRSSRPTSYARPVVLLQDYHLYLAARVHPRASGPTALLLHFNHIPWPSVDTWLVLPQGLRRAICEGLLANDIVGLQTDRYATQLPRHRRRVRARCAGRPRRPPRALARADDLGARISDLHRSRFAGQPSRADRRLPAVARSSCDRLERAGKPKLIVRVDRLEPSKNVLRGFLAFEALLKRRPDLRKTVRFLAIQSISRENVPEYARYAAAVREVVARVNGMSDPDAAPIWLLDGSEYALAIAALSLADVVLVNPVVDGMNLVAKEAAIVSRAALVLSETAGAAEQLAADALTVAAADVAGTSRDARARPRDVGRGARARLRRLRASVRERGPRMVADAASCATSQRSSRGGRPPSRALRDTVARIRPRAQGLS